MKTAKYILMLVVALLIINGCSGKEIKTLDQSDVFIKKYSIKPKNINNYSMFFVNLLCYKDSLLIGTDYYSKCLLKISRQDSSVVQIGRDGQGPGEYNKPYSIVLENDTIIINDESQTLKYLNFNGKYLKQKFVTRFIASNGMQKDSNNTLWFLCGGAVSSHYLRDENGGEYYKVPRFITRLPSGGREIGMFEHNNKIYFMNAYELKVFVYDKILNQESTIKLKGIEKAYDLEEYYNKFITGKQYADIMAKMVVIPGRFYKLLSGGNLYYLIQYVDMETKIPYTGIYDVQGECKAKISIDYNLFQSASNQFIGVKYNNKQTLEDIVIYKVNTETLDKL